MLDGDRDGSLSAAEKTADGARVVLYGHSLGRFPKRSPSPGNWRSDGIPVLLTIQVDSVSKPGSDDRLIPANVAQAVNFYQAGWGTPHGQREMVTPGCS